MKEKYAHIGLLVVAAIAVLVFLLRRSAVPSGNGTLAAQSPASDYPNAQPIKMGNFEVAGDSPTFLTINAPSHSLLGPRVVPSLNNDCACEANPCDQFLLQGTQKVPESVLKSAQENFLSFEQKLAAGGYGAAIPVEAVSY